MDIVIDKLYIGDIQNAQNFNLLKLNVKLNRTLHTYYE